MAITTNKNESYTIEYNGETIEINPYLTIEQRFNFAEDLYDILVLDTNDGLQFCELLIEPACRALFLSYCTDVNFENMNMLEVMNECVTSDIAVKCIDCDEDAYKALVGDILMYVREKYHNNKKSSKELAEENILSGISSIVDKLNSIDVDAAMNVINKFNNMNEKEIISEVVDKS